MSSISSASPRNSDCVTCIWLWMRPGMTMRPERSTRSAPAFSGVRPARPHVRDDAVFDEYVRVQDVPRWVHGDDGCVGEQCAHVFSPVVNRGVTLWLAGLMSGGGGCPEAGTQGSLPGSAVRRPSRKYSGWRGVRKGAGRTLPGGPYSAYYAVSCDNGMCVPLPCGAGPARFPCWHSEAAAPFFSLRPIASAVYRVVILSGSLAASSPEPQAPGVRPCVGFLNGSHVLSSRSSLCGALKRRCT